MSKLLKVRTDWEIMNLLQDSIMIKVAIYIYIFRCTIKIGTRYSLKLQSTRKTGFVGVSLEITVHPRLSVLRLSVLRLSEHQNWSKAEPSSVLFSEDMNR